LKFQTALWWTLLISTICSKHDASLSCGVSVVELAFSRLKTAFRCLINDDYTYDVPTHKLRAEYDFVVIGAGTSGCTVASRLTEVSAWNVLLLEAGGEENWLTDVPIFTHFLQLTEYNWGYWTEPESEACQAFEGRRCPWPRGKGMGGTSLINDMIYTRGNAMDYDGWEEMGNVGWGWNEVKKYFLKSENAIGDVIGSPHHSIGGELDVGPLRHK
jgi:choline dehydrogenase-like flavoprotein